MSLCSRAKLPRSAPFLAACAVLISSISGCNLGHMVPDPAIVQLASLSVSGGAGDLYPTFAPEIHHYAVRCEDDETLTISASPLDDATTLALNGTPVPQLTEKTVALSSDHDVAIGLGKGDEGVTYVIHCIPSDFPAVEIVLREPTVSDGLMLVTPRYNYNNKEISYLAILDNNGVPRYHRKTDRRASDFKWHARHRTYSYFERTGRNSYDQYDYVIVLLDQRFDEIDRATTVNLNHTDFHDFLMTDEGNYLFLSYNSVTRDLSAYPDEMGNLTYSTAELTRDSVIQEVSPQGELLFEWNSWDHMKISDCLQHRFPDDYAHVNSLHLIEGDIVASFRGCSQVLKIDRPSGRVLWQLGGSDPGEADLHDSARPVFDRPFYQIVSNPEDEGFCGQHSAIEARDGIVVIFDNGIHCLFDRTDRTDRDAAGRTRVVEYRLSGDQAVFQRHYQPVGQPRTVAAGAVQVLASSHWLITWGRGPQLSRSITEVDSDQREVFAMNITNPSESTEVALTYRVYRERGLDLPLNLP